MKPMVLSPLGDWRGARGVARAVVRARRKGVRVSCMLAFGFLMSSCDLLGV